MDTANTEALDRADMARLVGGHDAALNDLMDRHAPAVFRFLCRMLGNEDDANDLAQDTFVRVYRARESYKPDQKFCTWLFTIAGNLARNQFRWRSAIQPSRSTPNPTPPNNPERHPAIQYGHPTSGHGCHRARPSGACCVQNLPDDMREAIVLCEWEEMAVAEAAAVLQTTPRPSSPVSTAPAICFASG